MTRISFRKYILSMMVIIFGLPLGSLAQKYEIAFDRLTTDTGLSNDAVFDIVQDKYGFIWIGTFDGLNRYDGYNVKVYKNTPGDTTSLADNYIRALYVDDQNILWLGGLRGGLMRFDPVTETFTQYLTQLNQQYTAAFNAVVDICQDSTGALWIALLGGGFARFDPATAQFKHYYESEITWHENRSRVIQADPGGRIWVGTDNGLLLFDPRTEQRTYYRHDPKNPFSISGNEIRSSWRDAQNRLWIGTLNGLNLYEPETGRFYRYFYAENRQILDENSYIAIHQDATGEFWLPTGDKGLVRARIVSGNRPDSLKWEAYRYRHDPNQNNSLSHDDLRCILSDRSNSLWFGTAGGGISRLNLNKEQFWRLILRDHANVGGNPVRSVFQDKAGTLWIGIDDSGLLQYDRKANRATMHWADYDKPGTLNNPVVSALLEDRAGRFLVGTRGGGLALMDRQKGSFQTFPPDPNNPTAINNSVVNALCEDVAGRIWVGTDGGGLNLLDSATMAFKHYTTDSTAHSLSSNAIQAIFPDPDGTLWIATWDGFNHFDPHTERFQVYKNDPANPRSLSYNSVISVYQDSTGMVWLGTFGGGLNKFDPQTGLFTRYTEADGLANNVIYGVLGDDYGNLWLSTNNGLSKFNPRTETFRNFGKKDGLLSNQFYWGAAHKSWTGELFFGGSVGLNGFYPQPPDVRVPAVAITGFEIFDKPVDFDRSVFAVDSIALSYQQNFFSFDFAVLDYRDPSRNQFACILEGLNDDWIYCGGRNYINFTNLDGGDYTFRVRGANPDGVWSAGGASVKVRIIPPVWKRSWFYALEIALAVFFIIGGVMYTRMRVRQKMELQRKTNELNYAKEMQLSMLPKENVDLENLEIVGRMRTATEVGGDYFDFVQLSDGRYLVALGDATGHGVAAGLVVGMIKMAVIASVKTMQEGASILEIVANLNKALKGAIAQNYMGMSFSIGLLDPQKLSIAISSTGMPYPYYYDAATQTLISIELDGPPLGLLDEIFVQEQVIRLKPGDFVIELSDGFVERFSAKGEMWGFDALEVALADACRAAKSATDVVTWAYKACDGFARGRENDDDMTMVVLRVK